MSGYKTKSETVITPATWKHRVSTLKKTPTGLYNIVGWYGSTHASAMWRKAYEFLDVFRGLEVSGFDPQIDDWDPSFIRIEAEIMASASVIIIRLENNELFNGSLGSIAEIGMALTSAALRGQIVIVSIEEGLLTSLDEPGAIAQYMMVEMSLERLDKLPQLTPFLQVHRGDDLQELGILACEAAKQQMQNGLVGINFDEYQAKRYRREQNYPLRVVVGGSGGAYDESHEDDFEGKINLLADAYLAEGQVVKILSQGAIAEAWNIPYGSIDHIGVALSIRTILSIETEFKHEADVLVLPITSEAASKAAVTEIGLLLLHALTTGQDIKIYMEPFDPVDYIYHWLEDVDITHCSDEKSMRQALRRAGVGDSIMATAVQQEVFDTFEMFTAFMNGSPPTFKQVKQSLLGQTGSFHNADNIRRVRALVEAHLDRLHADERFLGFFTYHTHIKV